MKPKQANKLYAKLTPHEQAALAVGALVRQDKAEAEVILDSVERCTYLYQSVHAAYRRRVEGLFTLAGLYGVKYWKTRTLMLMAFNVCDDDPTRSIAKRFITKLASMEAALIDVCGQLKIDAELIKTMADCKGETETGFSNYVEAELVEQYTELFMQAVNA